jgi:hypothetical protein
MVACLLVVAVTGVSCVRRNTRGWWEHSPDSKTYLVIDDDNKTACGQVEVDGKPWPHAIHQRGAIEPGPHTIRCGGVIEFEIPTGVVFHFDYWGP